MSSTSSQGARAPRSAHATRNVYSQLSGLEDVGFNDFIKNDFIPEGDGGEYKCDAGMSVKNVSVVVVINPLLSRD